MYNNLCPQADILFAAKVTFAAEVTEALRVAETKGEPWSKSHEAQRRGLGRLEEYAQARLEAAGRGEDVVQVVVPAVSGADPAGARESSRMRRRTTRSSGGPVRVALQLEDRGVR